MSPTVPPQAVATNYPAYGFYAGSYVQPTFNGSANVFNLTASVVGNTGFAPSPGVAYNLWVSQDNRATWSVHRDTGNTPIAFKVTGYWPPFHRVRLGYLVAAQ